MKIIRFLNVLLWNDRMIIEKFGRIKGPVPRQSTKMLLTRDEKEGRV